MVNKCIQFKNSTGKQELYFYGDIVSDEWSKWTDTDTCPQDVLDILSKIDEKKPLNIYVNSGGGSVFAGMAMYNMLKRNKSDKTVYVDGLAGSIASVIAMAGDKIVMPSNSYLMIHHALCGVQDNAIGLRKMADTLDKIDEGIEEVYKTKLVNDVDIKTIIDMMDNETWLTGNEASKYFNIEVVESNEAIAYCGDIANYKNVPQGLKDKLETKEHEEIVKEPVEDKTHNVGLQNKEDLELAIAKLRIKLL